MVKLYVKMWVVRIDSLYHYNSVASWFQFSWFLGYNSQYESAIVPITSILTKFVKFNKECILLLRTSKDRLLGKVT